METGSVITTLQDLVKSSEVVINKQDKTDNTLNTTDKTISGAINEINSKETTNETNISSHTSNTSNPHNTNLSLLKDTTITNPTDKQQLGYDMATSKWINQDNVDEKVKINATSTSKYLGEWIDGITIQNVGGKLVAKSLDALDTTLRELNFISGLDENIMTKFSNIVNGNGGIEVYKNATFSTYASLLTFDFTTLISGKTYLIYVSADENHSNNGTTYICTNETNNITKLPYYCGLSSATQRILSIDKVDLTNEVKNKLSQNNMDMTDIVKTTDLNNYLKVNDASSTYATISSISSKANTSDVYTQTQTDNLLSNKVDEVANKSLVADSEIVKLQAITGTNTGDETQSTIKTKLGKANSTTDGYVSTTDWNTFNNKTKVNDSGVSGNLTDTYSINKILSLIGTGGGEAEIITVSSLPTIGQANKIYILSTNYSLNYYDSSWHLLSGGSSDNQIVIGTTPPTDITKLFLDISDKSKPILQWYDSTTTSWIDIGGGTIGAIARNVSNLRGTVSEGATNILLQWTNPNPTTPTDFQKREIYVNDSDLVNMDRDYWKANATLLNDTIGTGVNTVDSYTYTIPNEQLGKTLYFRSFCLYDFGTPTWSGGTGITLVAVDNIAPNKIEGLTAIQNKDSITVSWISNPIDSDFAGILVKMNDTNQYPTDRFSGMTVFDGKLKSFTLNNLDKSKTYSFRLFTYDTSGNYNNDVSMKIQVVMDNTPPLAVQNLTSTNGHQFIKLRWEETNCGTDWIKTYIVQKMGNASSFNISDGTLILTNQIKDTYKTNWFIVSGLTNSQSYTFTFFVEDVNGNIGNPISITDTPTASALPTPVAFNTDMNGTVQTEIKVSWINPFSSDYSGRILYHSLSDLSGKTKTQLDDMVTNSQADILNQGVGTGSGANDQYINNGITSGVTNYYAMVTKYNIGGTDYYSAVVDDNATTSDIVPPLDVTSLQVIGGDATLNISYTDPSDTDFDKTIIMVTKGSFQNYNYIGADLIYTEEATKDKYKTTPLVLTSTNGIVNNTTYYVWVYPRDIAGNKNTNVANRSSAIPVPLPIYGIQYDSSTRTWTRLGLALSMSATDFNTISPYKDIKRVLLTDAKAKTYLKSTDSTLKEDGTSATLDGTLGNVFSEFPKLYYKYENSGTIHKWYIANSAVGGCTPHKAFIRNSVTKDYLYMGCYKGYVNGTKLESRSGILPTTSGKSFADFRTLAEARGTGFTQFDSLSLHLLQVLFLIQYGHADFSTILNSGQDIGTILTSGGSNSLGNSTGVVGNYSSLYGLESLVGGSHSVIEGLIAGSKYWQSNNNFGSMTSESSTGTYSQLSIVTPSSTNGFISDIEPLDSIIIGKTQEGSSSDGFNDYQVSKNGSNLNVMLLGGSSLASQRGLFNNEFVDVTNMSNTTNMTSEGSIDSTYSVWSYTLDRSNFGLKSLSSYSLVDNVTPSIVANLQIQNLSGRLICY